MLIHTNKKFNAASTASYNKQSTKAQEGDNQVTWLSNTGRMTSNGTTAISCKQCKERKQKKFVYFRSLHKFLQILGEFSKQEILFPNTYFHNLVSDKRS